MGHEKKKLLECLPKKFPQVLKPEVCDTVTKIWQVPTKVCVVLLTVPVQPSTMIFLLKTKLSNQNMLQHLQDFRKLYQIVTNWEPTRENKECFFKQVYSNVDLIITDLKLQVYLVWTFSIEVQDFVV